jgi:RHS repeat-associated protein
MKMEYCLSGFNGKRPDPISGHYHLGNGYRAYNPIPGRFTCPDSWSPFGDGGINPYAYCAGDPVNRADPSGHFSLGQGLGMVLGLVGGFVLGVLTEGMALPIVASLLANMAGDAAIGALSELTTEAVDGQQINGRQVGMAALVNAGFSLAGFGLGRLSKLKGTRSRPFGGLMMEEAGDAGTSSTSRSRSGSMSRTSASGSNGSHSSSESVYEVPIGQGAGGRVYKDTAGYLRKDFHGLFSARRDRVQNELAIFRRVYGEESAELIGPRQTSMRMWQIPGEPLNSMELVATLTAEDRARLYDSLNHLHSLGIYHGDIKRTNILFDSANRRFHLIDFGLSRLTSDEILLSSEKSRLLELMANWPATN